MIIKIKKIRLLGSGNEGERNSFILSKENSFFSLFLIFLIGCGLKNIGIYEDYQENIPDINKFNNRLEHFKNPDYDINLIYTNDRIILIVRTDSHNKKKLIKGIENIAEF